MLLQIMVQLQMVARLSNKTNKIPINNTNSICKLNNLNNLNQYPKSNKSINWKLTTLSALNNKNKRIISQFSHINLNNKIICKTLHKPG